MNEKRKQNLTIGFVVGAMIAFLVVLLRRTPPAKRRETLVRAGRDGVNLARMRYGAVAAPLFILADHLLEQFADAESGEKQA